MSTFRRQDALKINNINPLFYWKDADNAKSERDEKKTKSGERKESDVDDSEAKGDEKKSDANDSTAKSDKGEVNKSIIGRLL